MIWLGLMGLIWLIIYPMVDFYTRYWSAAVVRGGKHGTHKIHLSFDDGPDPAYTPSILAILRRFGIPATFFVIGSKARQYPDLIRQMIAEGHEVGLHNQWHRHAYWMWAGASRRGIEQGKQTIEAITGKPVVWFRPPWGALNLFQYLTLRRLGLTVVLWSLEGHDWRRSSGAEGIFQRLTRRRIQSSSLVVLHDAGGERGAPLNTVTVLPRLLEYWRHSGFQLVDLNDFNGGSDAREQIGKMA